MSGLIYPVDGGRAKISQLYGSTEIDYSRFGLIGHNGIDFAGAIGDRILAVADGIVIQIGYEPQGYGHYIQVQHGDKVGIYAHLSAVRVQRGQQVSQGQQIADMGTSGNSTGPHLHFGIRPARYDRGNGYLGYIDPLPLFEPDGADQQIDTDGDRLVKVVSRIGANIRENGDGAVIGRLMPGTVIELTGLNRIGAGGLRRHQARVTFWIAERDFDGTAILADDG